MSGVKKYNYRDLCRNCIETNEADNWSNSYNLIPRSMNLRSLLPYPRYRSLEKEKRQNTAIFALFNEIIIN